MYYNQPDQENTMTHKILWTKATVEDGQLTVSLDETPNEHLAPTAWSGIFTQLVRETVPGVPYSTSWSWGPIQLSEGVITVRDVTDQAVGSLIAHLNAVVERTNEEYERYHQQQEHEAERHREEEQRAGAHDEELTRRFRQSGDH